MDEQPYTIEEVDEGETHYVPIEEGKHRYNEFCYCDPVIKVGSLGFCVIHNAFEHA